MSSLFFSVFFSFSLSVSFFENLLSKLTFLVAIPFLLTATTGFDLAFSFFSYSSLSYYLYISRWNSYRRMFHSLTICILLINDSNIPVLASSNAFRFSLIYSIENLRFKWSSPECFKTVKKSKASPWSHSYLNY